MKKFRKYLSIYLSIFIFIICCYKPINVSAIGGYFTTDSFTFSSTNVTIGDYVGGYYYMENDSNLPDTFHIYYKIEDGKAECCLLSELATNILNKKIGVTLSSSYLSLVVGYIQNVLKGVDVSSLVNLSGFLNNFRPVYKGQNMVGISINNITGCKMVYSTPDDKIEVPSDLVNNVYNIFQDYSININPANVDYFILELLDINDGLSFTTNNTQTRTDTEAYLRTSGIVSQLTSGGYLYSRSGSSYKNQFFELDSKDYIFVTYSDLIFNDFVHDFTLNDYDNFISKTELINGNTSQSLQCLVYDNEYNNITCNYYDLNGDLVSTYGRIILTGYGFPISFHGGKITIYKNINIPTSITNNTYSKAYYVSTIYNNYNNSSDNSYTTNTQNVSNSSNTNTQIYNQSQQTTNNNITNNNYEIDNSQNDNSVTNIINNYYPSDSGDDDDDDDDDSIWDALLKALGNFLKKIGELIGVILTGIIEICTNVLDAIASITESFTGITDFIASIFGFLPSEITAVLTLGITLAVLISLIKMFRG